MLASKYQNPRKEDVVESDGHGDEFCCGWLSVQVDIEKTSIRNYAPSSLHLEFGLADSQGNSLTLITCIPPLF
jgi:hypothetical protein